MTRAQAALSRARLRSGGARLRRKIDAKSAKNLTSPGTSGASGGLWGPPRSKLSNNLRKPPTTFQKPSSKNRSACIKSAPTDALRSPRPRRPPGAPQTPPKTTETPRKPPKTLESLGKPRKTSESCPGRLFPAARRARHSLPRAPLPRCRRSGRRRRCPPPGLPRRPSRASSLARPGLARPRSR